MFKFNKLKLSICLICISNNCVFLYTRKLYCGIFICIRTFVFICIIAKNYKMIQKSDIEEFQENGAVILRNILSQGKVTYTRFSLGKLPLHELNSESLDTLQRGIEYNLKYPSERAIQTEKSKTVGHFIEDFCNWSSNKVFS